MKPNHFELSTFNVPFIRVAIVEDHKVVAEGFERLINESDNIRVIGKAYSVAGSREMLAMAQPDVLLLDISLPDGNGIRLCTEIKAQYPQIKILILTSYNELFTINSALEAGADGYVLKNSMSEEVMEGIKTVVSGKRFLCDEAGAKLSDKGSHPMELTRREIELLRLIVEGLTLQELADKMCLGIQTIRSYRKNLNVKLGAHNTAQLVQKAKNLFSIMIVLFLLLAAACHSPRNSGDQPPQNMVAPDSLFTPTGDAKLDSLLRLSTVAAQDTNLARLYFDIGELYEDNDFEKAKEYFQKVGDLSEKLDWTHGRYLYAAGFSLILTREGLTDSSVVILKQALELAENDKNEAWIAEFNLNIGHAYCSKLWNETALTYYMTALPYYEQRNKKETLETLYYMMSQVYTNMNAIEKSIEYGEKAVALNPDNPYSLYGLGRIFSNESHHYEKGNEYFEKALEICHRENNTYLAGVIYYCLAVNALMDFDLKKCDMYIHQSIDINQKSGNQLGYLLLSGKLAQAKGHFAQAETYIHEALQLAEEWDIPSAKRHCYMILSELAVAQHKYSENVQYWRKIDLIEKILDQETNFRVAAEIEAQYETAKKELRISALEAEKRLLTWLGIAAGAVLLLALFTSLFLWRWTVQKRQLAETRIRQLEQEKQLIATQSLLDGENQERTRLARDLHDGLGSILAGAKLNLQELKKSTQMNTTTLHRYDTALGLLDESVREMRRVAHHLMPESLTVSGLKQAATDFCRTIPCVAFNWYGVETRFDMIIEVMIYRIMHELVTNALKHSGASHIMVQIICEPDCIALTVQDDGCGFDPSAPSKGMGLSNIRSRVAACNGTLMVDSNPGIGTEVNIEVNI